MKKVWKCSIKYCGSGVKFGKLRRHNVTHSAIPGQALQRQNLPALAPENAKTRAMQTLEQGEIFPFSSIQSLYVVGLKSSLRRRSTHARHDPHFVEKSIARLSFGSAELDAELLAVCWSSQCSLVAPALINLSIPPHLV